MSTEDRIVEKLIENAEQRIRDGKPITYNEYQYIKTIYGTNSDFAKEAKSLVQEGIALKIKEGNIIHYTK